MRKARKRRSGAFAKFYLLYTALLVLLFVLAIVHVRKSLTEFENSQPDKYMESFVSQLREDAETEKLIENAYLANSRLGDYLGEEELKSTFEERYRSFEFSAEPSRASYNSDAPLYDLLADGRQIAEISLEPYDSETRLGLMTLSKWRVGEAKARTEQLDELMASPVTAEEFPVKNALEIAETWSKLMTDDLGGGRRHGFAQLEQYLLKDSYIYGLAYDFAGSVDITFVSGHSLLGFTNEAVTNYVKYGEDLCSCDVYFEKNMYLTRMHENRTDVFDSKLFFVRKTDGADGAESWYLCDMEASE